MLRIVVPHTVRNPEVEAGLLASLDPGVSLEWADVSEDEFAYWRLMTRLWEECGASGDDLMIVEHDVVIRRDVVEGFLACPETWCTHHYTPYCHDACREAWSNMLGCTRFRHELIAATPDALTSIPDVWQTLPVYPLIHRRDWHNLCDEIAGDKIGGASVQGPLRPGSLRHAGYTHHWHYPPVRHISWEGHVRG